LILSPEYLDVAWRAETFCPDAELDPAEDGIADEDGLLEQGFLRYDRSVEWTMPTDLPSPQPLPRWIVSAVTAAAHVCMWRYKLARALFAMTFAADRVLGPHPLVGRLARLSAAAVGWATRSR
jgi:hypothetical protein